VLIRQELLKGCYAVETFRHADNRGIFYKAFSSEANLLFRHFSCKEIFYSLSKQNVVRGMHLQMGASSLEKIVLCMGGSILDVLVDLRAGDQFGRVASLELTEDVPTAIFVPRGVAHGFLSLSSQSLVTYFTSKVHAPDLDGGVHWRSIPFDWPVQDAITSSRDENLPQLADFTPIVIDEVSPQ
jgi:dTDP-4-dehydrorhamnose 3,5-epimerase